MVLGGFQGKSQSGLELEKKEKEAKKKAVASGAPVKEVSFWEGLQTLIAGMGLGSFRVWGDLGAYGFGWVWFRGGGLGVVWVVVCRRRGMENGNSL